MARRGTEPPGADSRPSAAMAALGIEESDYVEARLRRFAATAGIDFITLSDAMRTASAEAVRNGAPIDYFCFEHLGGPAATGTRPAMPWSERPWPMRFVRW